MFPTVSFPEAFPATHTTSSRTPSFILLWGIDHIFYTVHRPDYMLLPTLVWHIRRNIRSVPNRIAFFESDRDTVDEPLTWHLTIGVYNANSRTVLIKCEMITIKFTTAAGILRLTLLMKYQSGRVSRFVSEITEGKLIITLTFFLFCSNLVQGFGHSQTCHLWTRDKEMSPSSGNKLA